MAAHFARLALAVLLAPCAIAACSSDRPEQAPDEPSPVGHTFLSTGVEGTPIPGGGPLTVGFPDGRITADAGCNKFTGAVTLDDHVLRVSGLSATLMACADDRSGADEWLSGLLNSEPSWRLDGPRLTLHSDDRTVTLVDKEVAQPDRPVKGTPWLVTAYIAENAQVRSRALDEAKPTLTIAEDGGVSGSTGCNRLTGSADVAGTEITFRVATTRMACSPEVMEVEQAVLKALDGKAAATVDADALTLRNDNGAGLVLRAQ
ncbi:META domain-containing protein [Nocardia sp. NBC_00508]|uniref:META domain-containing protein n=1 Tax=Nocardia sp. NBC_00508 TaxID=2975992 RepID=UPI002E824364|nr:META domain-containing protein [Nocardia sp. NBC_00508]WUD65437.1 META domain-containing protein [Nocardia sp. NBC_00508]